MENRTTKLFKKICLMLYITGFPNFWTEEIKCLKHFKKIYKLVWRVLNIFVYALMIMELGAFYTQNDLGEKQINDRIIFSFSHPILYIIPVDLIYQKTRVRRVMYDLAVGLKAVHNDEVIEKSSVFKSQLYSFAFGSACFMALFTYGIDASINYIQGGTFVTVITAWPDIRDESISAHAVRVIAYIGWWICMTRVVAGYFLIITITTCLNHQFRNLASYIEGLDEIFLNDTISQEQKEEKYERGLKVGIKLHAEHIRCADEISTISYKAYGVHIIVYVIVFALQMSQLLKSGRNLVDILPIVSTGTTLLTVTGFLMWSAGDVTVQALNVSSAIYMSGWENCRRPSSARVRRLVVMAMTQAQKPLVFRTLGVIDLSYESYVSIVKSSYSVFSLLK